ncbi:hypothetical protein A5714_15655 [Mycobacterium sp. E2462]|nr:hypothetical protein A5714_15655 [Mycobacterium sp. E2462]
MAGLIEWPVLLAVGGGALLLQRLGRKHDAPAPKASLKAVPAEPEPEPKAQTPRPAPAGDAAPQKAARKAPAKKAAGRRAGTPPLRSTN